MVQYIQCVANVIMMKYGVVEWHVLALSAIPTVS